MGDRSRAEELNARALALEAAGQLVEAESGYRAACDCDPTWSVPWYNLGLQYKYQSRWAESFQANLRATELDATDQAAWWNLGIAATALSDWTTARRAWSASGIEMPEGTEPLELDYGPVAIRLNPEAAGEVVWARRVDPARAVIRSVPYSNSGYREGDVVLHDGAVAGTRLLNGHERPVFNALSLFKRSPRSTFEITLLAPAAFDIDALQAVAARRHVVVEDWTSSVREICRQCSEGIPHDEHVWAPVGWNPQRHVGVSAPHREAVEGMLRDWLSGRPDRAVENIVG